MSKIKWITLAFGGAAVFILASFVVAFMVVAIAAKWTCFPCTQFNFTQELALALIGATLLCTILTRWMKLGDLWITGGGILATVSLIFIVLLTLAVRNDPHWESNPDPIPGLILLTATGISCAFVFIGCRLNRPSVKTA